MFDCNIAPGGKKALMKWGWLKTLGGWLIKYAPGLVDAIMDAKSKEAPKKPPSQ
jgi:hypothetical protein